MKKMKLFLFLLLFPIFLYSQNRAVSGKVTDSSGEGLPGASISLKGTTAGTISDANGDYRISVPEGKSATLVFSFIGLITQEIEIGGKSTINVSLTSDNIGLEEVVAVGYSTQKRATITGSVASIKNEELIKTKTENVVNMLTGKLPGVRVVQKSSAPGAYDATIDIRGMGAPLFVIDGVTRDQAYFARMDPQEIESISVLKDGSAAIYGLRAANGVILVTTKSGTSQAGKVDFIYTGNYSIQQFLYVPEGVSAQDYMVLRNESVFQNFNNNYLVRQNPLFTQENMQPYIDGKPSYNWMDALFEKSTPEQQHNFSINGGNDKLRYFLSLGYAHQEGSYKGGGYNSERWNFRSTVDAQITKDLNAKVTVGAILDETNQPNSTGWSTFKAAWLMRPDAPMYANDNPEYLNGDAQLLYDGRNVLAEINPDISGSNKSNTRRLNGTLQLNYNIPGIKGLSLKGSYDYATYLPDYTYYKSSYNLYVYNPGTDVYTTAVKNSPSSIQRSANFNVDTDMQLGIHYNNKFGKHDLKSFLIFEEAYSTWDNFSAYRELLIASKYLFAGEALNQTATGGTPGDRLSQSVIGSATYDYSGKYLVDFRFRYDGSSRFPEGKRWGFFPSVSAGWRMSEESFIKDNVPVISNLKLRASYGEMGDDGSAANYPPTMGYSLTNSIGWMFGDVLNGGLQPQAIPNPNLTWYEIKMYNLGLDFGVFDNKLSGSFELFKRDRTGLLATGDVVVPGTVGASLPQANLNADRNFGWEITMTYRNKIRDFNYYINPLISSTRSMRTDWLETVANNQFDNWRNRTNGRYNNIWWGNESDHMFTSMEEIRNYKLPMGQGATPGDWILKDWNEDGVINAGDEHPIATTGLPLFNYGINLGCSWKDFDLALNFQGSYGVFVEYGEVLIQPLAFGGQNTLSYFLDRWRPEDPNADYFSPSTKWIPGYYPVTGHDGRRTGTNLVQNASYMRLKTLELGYNLPKNIISKANIKDLRIYLSGYNLLTFTGLKNVDPERPGTAGGATTSTVDFYNYPVNKIYTIGASLKF
ncbi:MAG: TonB-dependent receptor [Prolixibacteraceae bacterium]|nr:TonB-dependent receptor [Prolixibacteraceae bacterium]